MLGTLNPNGSVTERSSINLGEVPSDDPIAYMAGFNDGATGSKRAKAGAGDSLAPEYVKGYTHGKRVHSGKDPKPSWYRAL